MRPALACLISLSVGTVFSGDLSPGTWKMAVARGSDADLAVCIVKFERVGQQWNAELVTSNRAMGKLSVESMTVAGPILHLAMKVSDQDILFEGLIGNDAKRIIGSYGNAQRLITAYLTPTTDQFIDRDSMLLPREIPEPMKRYLELEKERARISQLVVKANDNDLAHVKDMLDEHHRKMELEGPALFQKILTEHASDPCAVEAGLGLLNQAFRGDMLPDRVKSWTEGTLKSAVTFGPRFHKDVLFKLTEYMARTPKAAALAVELAERAERELPIDAPKDLQARLLTIRLQALKRAGRDADVTLLAERLEKIETALDNAYRKPVLQASAPKERKKKDKPPHTVLVELFTGTQNLDGVASAAAFDKLIELYKPADVICMQYHVSRPGPDPLTNPDAEARFRYFEATHYEATDRLPTIWVDGGPRALGGGPLRMAREKLDEYRLALSRPLEETIDFKLSVKAVRTGNKVAITAEYRDFYEEKESVRLRLALVEDQVRYQGGNGVRFHRHVVRAMPGGAEGFEVNRDENKHEVTLDIGEMRRGLNKYLDEKLFEWGPFPYPQRPFDLQKLKVVAWMERDKNRLVLQSMQTDVVDQSK